MISTNSARVTHALRVVSGVGMFLGGALLACVTVVYSGQANGCVGPEECASHPMRIMPPLVATLGAVATALLIFGVAGLALLVTRGSENRATAKAGLIALTTGAGLLMAGSVVQAVLGDSPWMPVFVGSGVLALLNGVALVAWSSFAARLIPSWMAILAGASAVVALASNEQNTTILFVVPLAITSALMGGFICGSTFRRPRSRASASPALTS